MFDRITDALPVLTVGSVDGAPGPADFVDVEYSAARLLDASFLPGRLRRHPDFASACRAGFDGYFEPMYDWNSDETDLIFTPHWHSAKEVMDCVLEDLLVLAPDPANGSLAGHVGYLLGWLSALACSQPELAQMGRVLLASVLEKTAWWGTAH